MPTDLYVDELCWSDDTDLQLPYQTLMKLLVLISLVTQLTGQCAVYEDCQHVHDDGEQFTRHHSAPSHWSTWLAYSIMLRIHWFTHSFYNFTLLRVTFSSFNFWFIIFRLRFIVFVKKIHSHNSLERQYNTSNKHISSSFKRLRGTRWTTAFQSLMWPVDGIFVLPDVNQLVVSWHSLSSYGHRTFAVAGPTAWNSPSDDLRDLTLSTDSFRRLLKTRLFPEY